MSRFAAIFGVIVVALFGLELMPPVQSALVIPWTATLARICVGLIGLFDRHAVAFGDVVQSTSNGFGVAIQAGCNGVEVAIILAAAILAFPAPWRSKLAGIVAGVLAVQLLNIVRVISLFYLGQWSVRAFEWAHLYVWQALIMIDALVVWLLWLHWVRAGGEAAAAASPDPSPGTISHEAVKL
jgi:exosortase H (IPTLxxWG-CTERM-specific)